MLSGLLFTAAYIVYFKFINPAASNPGNWWLGISPEGIGSLGMVINFAVAFTVSRFTLQPLTTSRPWWMTCAFPAAPAWPTGIDHL